MCSTGRASESGGLLAGGLLAGVLLAGGCVVCSPCVCWWVHVLQPPPSTGARGRVGGGGGSCSSSATPVVLGTWCVVYGGWSETGKSPWGAAIQASVQRKGVGKWSGGGRPSCNTKWWVGGGLQEDGGSRTKRVTESKRLWAGVCRGAGHVFSRRVCESHCT